MVDSCKCSSVNRMAAGLRLPRSSHGIFLLFTNFSNTPYLTVATIFVLEQAVGPGVLLALSEHCNAQQSMHNSIVLHKMPAK